MSFEIYKKTQGKKTRLISAIAGSVIVGLGCLRLYNILMANDLNPWVQTMVPAGLFVTLSAIIFWLVNKPTLADFMIQAEGEMKKVSWSTKSEIMVSTIVVISVVIIMAVILGVADILFTWVFGKILA